MVVDVKDVLADAIHLAAELVVVVALDVKVLVIQVAKTGAIVAEEGVLVIAMAVMVVAKPVALLVQLLAAIARATVQANATKPVKLLVLPLVRVVDLVTILVEDVKVVLGLAKIHVAVIARADVRVIVQALV